MEHPDLHLPTIHKSVTAKALERFQGSRHKAAKAMGISIRTLRNWVHKFGLDAAFPSKPGRQGE